MKKIKLRLTQAIILASYILLKPISHVFGKKYKNVWLISEMGNEAKDNGYAFYRYMAEKHPEIDARYVISKKSPDYEKVKKIGKIIPYRSISHYFAYMKSKVLISSQIMGYSPEYRSFTKLHKRFKFFAGNGKKVFLQHGITKDYIEGITSKNINLDLFICGAKPEYEYIKKEYGFSDGVVKYTGFPRYDNLKNDKKDYILYMPTWRKTLFYQNSIDDFKKTQFYNKVTEILTDRTINDCLKKNNKKIIFYPHHEIQPYISAFNGCKNKNIIVASKKDYEVQKLLNQCCMLITDYSSVFFDVAFLKKPIVYYQFDYEDYRCNHYSEGYFDYLRDGFGPAIDSHDKTVNAIINYIDNNFIVEKKYQEKRKAFFKYSSEENCQRVYEAIKELLCQ